MAYFDGELLLDRASATAAHLRQCPDCQRLAADLQGLSQRLMAWQVDSPGPRVSDGIAAALDERARKPVAAARNGRRSWRLAPWLWGVAAASVLLVFASLPRVVMHKAARPALAVQSQILQSSPAATARIPMIARTSQLVLTTQEFDKTRRSLEDTLKRHSGYVGQLSVSAPAGAGRVLEATLRTPADRLDLVTAELKKLGRVESESQQGEEVTQQYVDLTARLSNARNAESRLTDLLRQRTGKLADVLAVELEIDRVRGEIERMEAEKKNLANRVDFATLNVKLVEEFQAQLGMARDSTTSRFRNAAVEGVRSMVEGFFSLLLLLLAYGPSFLLWGGLLFFPVRFVWMRWRRDRAR